MKDLVQAAERSLSPALVLALTFAALYAAVGPGYLYSVDEVNDVETAQAVLERGTLEVPAMHVLVSQQGVAGGHYSVKPPALAYVGLPPVALGNLLDDAAGSLNGGAAQGPPTGTEEHPLRWGGRLSVFTALIGNALLGGAAVALLFLIGRRLGASRRTSLSMAVVSGLATLLMSESTHFLRHPLEALGLLLGFCGFSPTRTPARSGDECCWGRRVSASPSCPARIRRRPPWCCGFTASSRPGRRPREPAIPGLGSGGFSRPPPSA